MAQGTVRRREDALGCAVADHPPGWRCGFLVDAVLTTQGRDVKQETPAKSWPAAPGGVTGGCSVWGRFGGGSWAFEDR